MNLFVCFVYVLRRGESEEFAVAIFPAHKTVVLAGGAVCRVRYQEGVDWFDLSAVPESLAWLEADKALEYLQTKVKSLIDDGVISGDPSPAAAGKPVLQLRGQRE